VYGTLVTSYCISGNSINTIFNFLTEEEKVLSEKEKEKERVEKEKEKLDRITEAAKERVDYSKPKHSQIFYQATHNSCVYFEHISRFNLFINVRNFCVK
jgi:hypothetical protein